MSGEYPTPSGSIVCPNGHANDAGVRYCVVCGSSLSAEALGLAPTVAPSATLLPYPPEPAVPALGGGVTPEERRAKSRRTKRTVGVIALVVAVLAAGGIAAYFILMKPVPSVTNLSQVAAAHALASEGFVLGSQEKEFSSSVAKGSVISQAPGGGSRARSGTSVDLTVSRGPAVSVPDVKGDPINLAEKSLAGAELTVSRTERMSETVPEGSVIDQRPAPGTTVETDTEVALIVSTGPPARTVTVKLNLFNDYDVCSVGLGYFDVPGASVIIEADGEAVGIGRLDYGTPDGLVCVFTAEVPDVPTTASSYTMTIGGGNRGSITNSRAELEATDWEWGVSLGL